MWNNPTPWGGSAFKFPASLQVWLQLGSSKMSVHPWLNEAQKFYLSSCLIAHLWSEYSTTCWDIGLYEPHLNFKAEGQGGKLPSFTNSLWASLQSEERRQNAEPFSLRWKNDANRNTQVISRSSSILVWAGYYLSLSVLTWLLYEKDQGIWIYCVYLYT